MYESFFQVALSQLFWAQWCIRQMHLAAQTKKNKEKNNILITLRTESFGSNVCKLYI